MRPSYRRHVVWRTFTRTRYLLAVALIVAVVLVALDTHKRPTNCTYYYAHALRKTTAGKCIPNGQRPPSGWTLIP